MGIQTNASQPYSLNKADISKWLYNLLVFLAPVALIYITAVLAIIQIPGHLVSFQDFAPSGVTLGAIALYIVNGIYDLLRKFVGSNS